MEAQKVTELTIEEEDKEHLHLPLHVLVSGFFFLFVLFMCSNVVNHCVLL